jgi:hypothetical protein
VKRAWSKAVYINQAVTRQTRLQLVHRAPPDPNRAPPDPNRAPPDPNRAPPGPDPAPKPSRIGLGRLALTRCCRSGCQSGAAAAGDCIRVGRPPSPLPRRPVGVDPMLPLPERRRRSWCRRRCTDGRYGGAIQACRAENWSRMDGAQCCTRNFKDYSFKDNS